MSAKRALRVAGTIFVAALWAMAVGQSAHAQNTYAWNGNTSIDWTNAANWTPSSGTPASGDIALFSNSTAYTNMPNTDAPESSVGGIWDIGSEALTINGNKGTPLLINGTTINGNANTGIEMDPAAGPLTSVGYLALGASQTWLNNSSSPLTLTRSVANGGYNLTIAGTGAGGVAANSIISGGGALIENGSLTLTLTAINTYTGGTTVNGGTLALPFNSVATNGIILGNLTINGGGTVDADTGWSMGYVGGTCVSGITINGGVLTFTGTAGNGGTSASAITMTGGTIGGLSPDWYNGITSTPTLTTNASTATAVISSGLNLRLSGNYLTFNVAAGTTGGADLLVSGAIIQGSNNSGVDGIVKTGAGMMNLTAANTYGGPTTVNAGTLQVAAGGSISGGSVAVNGGVFSLLGGARCPKRQRQRRKRRLQRNFRRRHRRRGNDLYPHQRFGNVGRLQHLHGRHHRQRGHACVAVQFALSLDRIHPGQSDDQQRRHSQRRRGLGPRMGRRRPLRQRNRRQRGRAQLYRRGQHRRHVGQHDYDDRRHDQRGDARLVRRHHRQPNGHHQRQHGDGRDQQRLQPSVGQQRQPHVQCCCGDHGRRRLARQRSDCPERPLRRVRRRHQDGRGHDEPDRRQLLHRGDHGQQWHAQSRRLAVRLKRYGQWRGAAFNETSTGVISGTAANFTLASGSATLSGTDTFTGSGRGATAIPALNVEQGTLAVSGGSITVIGAPSLALGAAGVATDTPTYSQTGGTVVAVGNAYVGYAANNGLSTFNISGGSFSNGTSTMFVSNSSSGVVNVSGAGSLNVGSFQAGNSAGATGTINLSSGNLQFNPSGGYSFLGYAPGSPGVLNISGGTATNVAGYGVEVGFIYTGINPAATTGGAGAINQSGGLFNFGSGYPVVGYGNQSNKGGNCVYGGYILSAGTLNAAGLFLGYDSQGLGLFSQSGGVANFSGGIYTCGAAQGLAAGVIDISGGALTQSTTGVVMDTGVSSGTAGAGYGILTVRGSGYFQTQSPNFLVTASSVATGVVNLLTGGILEVNQISASGGTSTINFDGGTLRAYNTGASHTILSGLTNAYVYPGGLTVDTNGQSVAISQNLTAPAGYGVGTSGSTLSVASGGSGYIAPPVVTFAAPAAGGVPATGVAVINGSGTVTGITITSPGSGYASGENVAILFNGGDNSSGAAVTPATGFNAPAGTRNLSGGLTLTGNGLLTLNGASTYSGPTTISAGTLDLGDNNRLPTATALTIASGGAFDLAGNVQTVGSLSGSAGAIVMNSLSSSYLSTLTVAPSAGSTTFAGNIVGNNALALSGSGALTLSGTNSYYGGTTVSGGTLDIAAPSALSGSGLVTIAAGGRLVLGTGAGIGALLAASSPVGSDAVALSAAAAPATLGGPQSGYENMATLGDAPASSQGGAGSAVGGTAAAVPEPGTIALLAAAAVGLVAWARRRKTT